MSIMFFFKMINFHQVTSNRLVCVCVFFKLICNIYTIDFLCDISWKFEEKIVPIDIWSLGLQHIYIGLLLSTCKRKKIKRYSFANNDYPENRKINKN